MNEVQHSNKRKDCNVDDCCDFPSLRNLRIPYILGVDVLIAPVTLGILYIILVVALGQELFTNDDDNHRNGD